MRDTTKNYPEAEMLPAKKLDKLAANQDINLENKLKALENQLQSLKKALDFSQKRYDIAIGLADVVIFGYDVESKKLIMPPEDFEVFGLPGNLENGVEDIIASGIIIEKSQADIRAMYAKIEAGAAVADCTVFVKDLYGGERVIALQLVNMFDENGKPIYAVGVRKDITEAIQFKQEKEYNNLLASELTFIYEANVSQGRLLRCDPEWAASVGLGEVNTLEGVLKLMCQRHVAPEDAQLFYKNQSAKYLLDVFAKGERVVAFEYRKWLKDKGYCWFEVRVNLIEDVVTKDVNMRVYISNIDSKKNDAMRDLVGRRRYELALSKSTTTCEINVTQNTITWDNDNLTEQFKSSPTGAYAQKLLPLVLKFIHPNEQTAMFDLLSPSSLLKAYGSGKTDLIGECRWLNKSGNYVWYRCNLQLFEDITTKDVMCYAYMEDIDEEKQKAMNLLYQAQHDLMTGFYNKKVVAEKINEFLKSEEGKAGTHIFFIIDLDYFKLINDNFGHAFGDAVLSAVAGKISQLFRKSDILGRIGGDEFVAFMKNVKNDKIGFLKAQEICDSVFEIYMQDGVEYRVSVSVGVAIFDEHGTNYEQLYRHSDTALYDAKEQGRNRFSVYQQDMQLNHSAVKAIEQRLCCETRTFESNISDYVFRILYESSEKRQAINAVLELVGKHYNLSRAYVFELSADEEYLCNTFEWCNKGVSSQLAVLDDIPYSKVSNYKDYFSSEGIFYIADVGTMPSPIKEFLASQKNKSMLQFSIIRNGKFAGFIGLDECTRFRVPENNELNDYCTFANILGVFITEMRAFEHIAAIENVALSIVNGLDSFAYVCNPETYELLFVNGKIAEVTPTVKLGLPCYKAIFGLDAPCENCQMQELIAAKKDKIVVIRHVKDQTEWYKVTSSWVTWADTIRVCLTNIMDITEFQKINLNLNKSIE